ncbi:hypothetical protein DPMN_007832 [Dreissena polymorpha]|uniref:Uncharacterized protein n=1 Tax=Dreissena polymorpha TaxID=45954 RepID=A0A9D4MY30_DREPO|nr:hypothetical protein DPMN_007832 [Dreissena polymorpha]
MTKSDITDNQGLWFIKEIIVHHVSMDISPQIHRFGNGPVSFECLFQAVVGTPDCQIASQWPVLMSLAKSYGQSVARSNGKSLAKSYGQSVARSNGKSLAKSYDQSVARSNGKSLAKSYGQPVARSNGKSLAKSYGQSVARFNVQKKALANSVDPDETPDDAASGMNGFS